MTTPAVNINLPSLFEWKTYRAVYPTGASDPANRPGLVTQTLFKSARPKSSSPGYHDNGFMRFTYWWNTGIKIENLRGSLEEYRTDTKQVITYPPGEVGSALYYSLVPSAVPTDGLLSVKSLARNRALASLRSSDFNLGVTIAEGRQTLDLIASSVRRITRSVYRFRRSHKDLWNNRHKWHLAVPQAWLELTYGWRPLLNDIYNGLLYLETEARRQGFVAHASGKAGRTSPVKFSANWSPMMWVGENRVLAETNLYFRLNSEKQVRLNDLGLTNPALIVWEKVPYSFVVDWFLPVGTFLEALGAPYGWTYLAGCESSIARLSCKMVVNPDCNAVWKMRGSASAEITGHDFHRELVGLPLAAIPMWKNPLSASHVMSAYSLLHVAIFR